MTEDRDFTKLISVYVVLGILLFFLDLNGYLNFVYKGLNRVTKPVEIQANEVGNWVQYSLESVTAIQGLRAENHLLSLELAKYESEADICGELKQENQQLREQLSHASLGQVKYLETRIVSYSPSPAGWSMKLDKGSLDGVSAGDVVVYGDVMIGKVAKVEPYLSYLRLVNSSDSNILSFVEQTGVKGVVTGTEDDFYLEEVLQSKEISSGQKVLTWNDRLSIPLSIGEITEVESIETEPTKRAKLEPIIDFEELKYVFIAQRFDN